MGQIVAQSLAIHGAQRCESVIVMNSAISTNFGKENDTAQFLPELAYRKWVIGLLLLTLLFSVLPTGLSWDFDAASDMSKGSIVRKLQWVSLFALAFFLAWKKKFEYLRYFLWGNIFLWMLLVFAALSVLWSPAPVNAFRQVVQFFGVLLVCYVISIYFLKNTQRVFEYGFYLLATVLVLSVLIVIIDPVQGKESVIGIEGSWRGILEQKNALGIASGVTFLFWLYVQTTTVQKPVVSLFLLALIVTCLLGSRSSSSLFFGLISSLLYFLLYKDRIRTSLLFVRVSLIAATLFVSANLIFFFWANRVLSFSDVAGPFSSLFGKSSDLTGRADIWVLVWQSIGQHWLFGTGFASFWLGQGGPSQFISDALQWSVPTAHNGYLEVLNELGLVGVALFVGMLLNHVRNLISIFHHFRPHAALHIALLLIFLISNFSESTALKVTSFLQVLLFLSMMMTQAACIQLEHADAELKFKGYV